MSNGKNLTKRLIKKRIMTAFEWKTFFCLESRIHLCSRHTSANPAYVIKTCVTWHAIFGARYWGFVSPKLHVSTYRNQQHCWWFHDKINIKINLPRQPTNQNNNSTRQQRTDTKEGGSVITLIEK